MTTAIRRSIAAIAIVALIALMELLGAARAQAQCRSYNVTNRTTCDVIITVYNGVGSLASYKAPAGTTITATLPLGFGTPVGIVTAAGTQVPFDPQTGCTPCATFPGLNGGPGCCATLCPNLFGTRCSLVLAPCPAPCIP